MLEKDFRNLLVANEEKSSRSLKTIISSKSEKEIKELLESQEFIDFVQTIADSLADDSTFDNVLSSEKVLGKALEVLKLQTVKDE